MNTIRTGQGTYSNRSLHGRVVHQLGVRIVSGRIAAGSVLPNEADLGTELSVSRTALREGIKVLAAKGLLESRTRTGTRVRPRTDWNMLDPDVLAWSFAEGPEEAFLHDLFEFRCTFEPMAASLAAERASQEEVQAIKEAYHDMVAAGTDVEAGIGPDIRFHKGVLYASGNELLAPLGALIETALGYSFRLSRSESKLETLPHHQAVLEAIVEQNPRAAHEAMQYLLARGVEYVNTALDKQST